MARVSVLLPVYNVEAYVAEALASIQSQTLSDIEIVVVDDRSTDGTLRIVEQIASSDSRIRIVRTPRNIGLPAALNFGLPFCRASLIARMDGDDIALPTRLEKQLRLLDENPEIAVVGCATSAIDQLGRPIQGLGVSIKPITQKSIVKTAELATPCLHIWMARREVYDTLSGYRELTCAEDYDFLLRAISAGFQITNLPESLMLIRNRLGNLSSRLEQRKAHRYIVRLYQERLKRGQDSFNPERYQRAVSTGKFEDFAFRLALSCVQKGLRSPSRIMRVLWVLASAMLSPWQARYFLDRVRFRVSMRMSMRAT